MEIWLGPYGMQSPHPYRRSHVRIYRELVEHVQRAEELGIDGFALTEHSFWYDGYCTSLLPVLAGLAQSTQKIKLVTGALLLAQHDPLKVAEEAAVVDRLSNGRLVLGFGVGYRPEEFLGHGVPEGRWGARCLEAIEVVRRALTEETFSFEGEFYRYKEVSIPTRPIQQPPPIWFCAGFAEWSAKAAGRRGWPYITTGAMGKPDRYLFDLYEEAAKKAGRDPQTLQRGLFRDILVGPTEEEAQRLLKEDFWPAMEDQFIGFGFLKMKNPDGSQVTKLPESVKKSMLNDPSRLVGTPESIVKRLKRVRELKISAMLVRTIWANWRHERALATMETFAREVMPSLKDGGS